jgi:hypothetical protein
MHHIYQIYDQHIFSPNSTCEKRGVIIVHKIKHVVLLCRNNPTLQLPGLVLERRTLRHYKGMNQALEPRVQRPDPVVCHHLSYVT